MNGDGTNSGPPFYGKYRGTVTDNRDPNNLGRIRAQVQDVFGSQDSGWATPCVPYAGKGVGLFLLPPVSAWVWIEFEHGDPERPIWAGCFWADGEVPASPAAPETKVLITDTVSIKIDDSSPGAGNFAVENDASSHLALNGQDVDVTNGQAVIKLSGSSMNVNNGGLEVT